MKKLILPLLFLSTLILAYTFGSGMHGQSDGIDGQFNLPMGAFTAHSGFIVVDTHNHALRYVDNKGVITTLNATLSARDNFGRLLGGYANGPLENALFNLPHQGVADSRGRYFITDTGNGAIRLIEGGVVSTFVSGLAAPTGIAIDDHDNLFVLNSLDHQVLKIDPQGNKTPLAGQAGVYGYQNGATDEALFNYPMGIALGNDGQIFVADTNNHVIRLIHNGEVTTLAGTVVPDPDAHEADGFLALGGYASGDDPLFNLPIGLLMFENTLLVADSANHLIRGIDLTLNEGIEVFNLLGTGYPDDLHLPSGLGMMGDYLLVVDTANNMIRQIYLAYAHQLLHLS